MAWDLINNYLLYFEVFENEHQKDRIRIGEILWFLSKYLLQHLHNLWWWTSGSGPANQGWTHSTHFWKSGERRRCICLASVMQQCFTMENKKKTKTFWDELTWNESLHPHEVTNRVSENIMATQHSQLIGWIFANNINFCLHLEVQVPQNNVQGNVLAFQMFIQLTRAVWVEWLFISTTISTIMHAKL